MDPAPGIGLVTSAQSDLHSWWKMALDLVPSAFPIPRVRMDREKPGPVVEVDAAEEEARLL